MNSGLRRDTAGSGAAPPTTMNAAEEMRAANEGRKRFFDERHAGCPACRKPERDTGKNLTR